MPKRHKHAKKSARNSTTKRGQNPKGHSTKQKNVEKDPKKRGSKNVGKTGKRRSQRVAGSKPVSKGSKIPSRGTHAKLRNSPSAKATSKSRGNNTAKSKRAKATGRSKNRTRGTYVERLRERREIERQIAELKERSENLAIEVEKKRPDFSERKQPLKARRFIQTKEGEKLKERKISGYRYIYDMLFVKGSFTQKIKQIQNTDLSFLNHGLTRNKKAPRAVIVTLTSKTRDGLLRHFKSVSPFDFVVNKNNVKKFILECMIEWQDRFMIGMIDRGDDYLEGSGKEYNPDDLYSVAIQFIY